MTVLAASSNPFREAQPKSGAETGQTFPLRTWITGHGYKDALSLATGFTARYALKVAFATAAASLTGAAMPAWATVAVLSAGAATTGAIAALTVNGLCQVIQDTHREGWRHTRPWTRNGLTRLGHSFKQGFFAEDWKKKALFGAAGSLAANFLVPGLSHDYVGEKLHSLAASEKVQAVLARCSGAGKNFLLAAREMCGVARKSLASLDIGALVGIDSAYGEEIPPKTEVVARDVALPALLPTGLASLFENADLAPKVETYKGSLDKYWRGVIDKLANGETVSPRRQVGLVNELIHQATKNHDFATAQTLAKAALDHLGSDIDASTRSGRLFLKNFAHLGIDGDAAPAVSGEPAPHLAMGDDTAQKVRDLQDQYATLDQHDADLRKSGPALFAPLYECVSDKDGGIVNWATSQKRCPGLATEAYEKMKTIVAEVQIRSPRDLWIYERANLGAMRAELRNQLEHLGVRPGRNIPSAAFAGAAL